MSIFKKRLKVEGNEPSVGLHFKGRDGEEWHGRATIKQVERVMRSTGLDKMQAESLIIEVNAKAALDGGSIRKEKE